MASVSWVVIFVIDKVFIDRHDKPGIYRYSNPMYLSSQQAKSSRSGFSQGRILYGIKNNKPRHWHRTYFAQQSMQVSTQRARRKRILASLASLVGFAVQDTNLTLL